MKMNALTLRVVQVFTACFFCCFLTTAAPVLTADSKAIMYLQRYGYMKEKDSTSASLMDRAALSNAIKDFQTFAGLAETGILDKPTLDMMSMPRCGVKDKIGNSGSIHRMKRYAHEGSKWKVQNLSYKIANYPSSIKYKTLVDREIAKAFEVWSNASSMSFEVASMKRNHIEISFVRDEHSDDYPFDGRGGDLAHAFFPQYGGDVHFDDDEIWSINVSTGTNLFQVAVHEFGHSLGLDHSNVKTSVMWPFHENELDFKLDEDDILGIQYLYGPPPPPMENAPDLCQDSSIDAAMVTANEKTYFFKGNYYWEIMDDGIRDGYPRKISDDWSGLSGNLDGALAESSGRTFFFKKNRYWIYRNKELVVDGYLNTARGLKMVPSDMDAILAWKDNVYIFKGDKYWLYDGRKSPPVSSIYPLSISLWKGFPTNIDAGLQWTNNSTYIFKGNEYYRINDKTQSVDAADPPYPRLTSTWWLRNCEKAPDLCQDSTIDAAMETEHGQTEGTFYVFKGNFYWEIDKIGIRDGYPKRISDDWSGLPGDLDAALRWSDGKTFFFKKNLYWRFQGKKLDKGYPQNISTGFEGIPNDIDAAFVWNLNKKTYFFKGNKYWRYDSRSNPKISSHYPQPISNWHGLPNDIDAASLYLNNVLFFKGSQYYKLSDKTPNVIVPESPYSSYPRSTYIYIFDCEGWKKIELKRSK